MKTILIISALFCAYKILSGLSASRKETERKAEVQHIRDEQTMQREQIKAEIERAKLETKERIEAEKRHLEWQKRQDEINRKAEQDRIRIEKEQERQAEQLERHEAELRKARFEIEQNSADIAFLQERTSELYAQIDYYTLLQAGTVPGGKEHSKYQSKIVTLHNQVHTAENKLRRAEWCKAEAERKMN